VYPSIGTLIGIGQKNSLNFVFTDFGVVENFFVLRSSSSLNKIWLEVFIIPLLIYFIAFYFKYYAYIFLTFTVKLSSCITVLNFNLETHRIIQRESNDIYSFVIQLLYN
jgi:hypothetical protein